MTKLFFPQIFKNLSLFFFGGVVVFTKSCLVDNCYFSCHLQYTSPVLVTQREKKKHNGEK